MGRPWKGRWTNLVNGRTYHFAVSALNGAGEGELSEPKTAQPYRAANRPPGKPDAPVLIPKNTQIAVYWSLPDDGGIVDGYEGVIKKVRIYYAEGSEPAKTSPYVEVDVSDGTSEGLITNLTNMTSYSIGVTAINDEGEGELSDSTTGIPTPYHINQVPAAPTDVQVSAGDGKLTVSWKEALDTGSYNNQKGTIQNFRVYYGAGSIDGSTPAYETRAYSDPPEDPWTLTIDGLTNGDTYNLVVTAFNEEGESLPSAEVQGMPLGL